MTAETQLTREDAEQYRTQPVMRFPMGSAAELLYFPLKKVARVVSAEQAGMLAACGQFASLQLHAERILAGLPPGTAHAVGAVELLSAFAADGMMLSVTDLMNRVASLPRPEPSPRIAWLAIPTCDRPELLRRCIRSYGDHFRNYGRFPKLLIADDSRTAEVAASTKTVALDEARTWGAPVVYVGLAEKRRLIDRLAAGGSIPRAVLEFGILGPGGPAQGAGANRNTILLHARGDLILSVDDDTVCEPCISPESVHAGLKFGGDVDPSEYWFFPDRRSALEFVQRTEVDVLTAHQQMLGNPVHSLMEPLARDAGSDMGSACAHIIRSLWEGQGSVLITSNGTVGDSGMYSGRNFPLHRGAETRRRLLASEDGYRSALQSREVLRQTPVTTVSHGASFMSMFFGMDARSALPPFFPVGHCDDGVFAYVAERCQDGCYFGYLPWALVHDPAPGRGYFGMAAETVRISEIVMACGSTWSNPTHGAPRGDQMKAFGSHLQALAALAPGDFYEYTRVLMWQHAARRMSLHEALLRQHGGLPDYWAADLRREGERRLAVLNKPEYVIPVDLPKLDGETQAAQGIVARYGQLVSCWPDVMDSARQAAVGGSC